MTIHYPTPFLRGDIWYFRYTDEYGKRIARSTRCRKKREAIDQIKFFIDALHSDGISETTLGGMISLYARVETNPRYIDAQATGGHYGFRYARQIARQASCLLEILHDRKTLLNRPIHLINRRTVKDIGVIITENFGRTVKSQQLYKCLKVMFTQAADDGLIMQSPAMNLPDIHTKPTRLKFALSATDIKKVIGIDSVFSCREARDSFIVLATTGLRRSEFLALHKSQLQGDVLVVNRAYKDDECKTVGLPKWDKVRSLALPDIAQEALQSLFRDGDSISVTYRRLATYMTQIGRNAGKMEDLEMQSYWPRLSPHILRHSLNTMLRLEGLPDVLVAEYMSWEHQDGNQVQEMYTHLYAKDLKPVADAIDRLVGKGKRAFFMTANS